MFSVSSKRPLISHADAEQKSFARFFSLVQATQHNNWAQSNLVIQGRPVEEVQQAVNDGEISLNARLQARAALNSSYCCV
jgi:pectin methylesterase-like acyl-CoA thioesterase